MAANEPSATVEPLTSPGERQVAVHASENVDLTFLRVLSLIPGVNLDDFATVRAEATAGFGILHVDTYLDIDATGSMGSGCSGGVCPIDNAKTAAINFTNTLLSDTIGSGATKVGVGAFRGCYNPPWNGFWSYCVPVSTMVRELTNTKSQVISTINNISAQGYTNICSGMKKGQDILFGPSGQTGPNTLKIMVVLADGDNNYSAYTYNGSNSPDPACQPTYPTQSDQDYTSSSCLPVHTQQKKLDIKTRDLANALKSAGVEIYVVGFGVCSTNDPNQFPTTSYCSGIGNNDHDNIGNRRLLKCIASSTTGTNDHYFEVASASQLPDVFGQIARLIGFRLIK
jgi:hypothetical protein